MTIECEYYESGEEYSIYKAGELFLIVDRTYNDMDHYVLAHNEEEAHKYVRGLE